MKRMLFLAVLFLLPSHAPAQAQPPGGSATAPAQAGPPAAPPDAAPQDSVPPSPAEATKTRALALDEAISIALEQSPVVRGAVADLDAALARLEQARAARRPAVSANTFASAGNAMNILPGVAPVEPQMFMIVSPGLFVDQNAMAMVPLLNGGRLRALTRGAAALRGASRADLETTRQEVVLMTRVAYWEAAARRSLIAVAEATVVATTERLRNARLLFEEGRVPLLNVRREEAELANAQQQLANARRDLDISLLQLKTVIGLDPQADIQPAESLTYQPSSDLFEPGPAGEGKPSEASPGRLPGSLPGLLALAERQRAELQAAAQRAASERYKAVATRALYRPQVAGVAMTDLAAGTDSGVTPNVTLGAAASLPILDGGLRRAEVREAEAMRRKQEEERKRIALQVGQEVATALANLRAAEQNVATARTGITAAEEDYRLSVARFEAGRSVLVEVLDAQAALTRARTNEVQALFDYNVAQDRLLRAVGAPVAGTEERG